MFLRGRGLQMYGRFDRERRIEFLGRLCLGLTNCAREVLNQDVPDMARVRAWAELLHRAMTQLVPLSAGPAKPIGAAEPSERWGELFVLAEQSGIAAQFQSVWDEAMNYVKTSLLGPGANINMLLADITDRAKARIKEVSAPFAREGKEIIPLICWGMADAPMIGGFYDERDGIEEDIVTLNGLAIVLAADSNDDVRRFRGKTLDFDGTALVLI